MDKPRLSARTVVPGGSYFFPKALEVWNGGAFISACPIFKEEQEKNITHSCGLQALIGKPACSNADLIIDIVTGTSNNVVTRDSILDYCESSGLEKAAFVDLCMVLRKGKRALDFAGRSGEKFDIIEITRPAFTNNILDREVLTDSLVEALSPFVADSANWGDRSRELTLLIYELTVASGRLGFLSLCRMYSMGYRWDAIVLMRILFPREPLLLSFLQEVVSSRPSRSEQHQTSTRAELPRLDQDCLPNIEQLSVIDAYRLVKLKIVESDRLGSSDTGLLARSESCELFRVVLLECVARGHVKEGIAITEDFLDLLKVLSCNAEFLHFLQRTIFKGTCTLLCGISALVLKLKSVKQTEPLSDAISNIVHVVDNALEDAGEGFSKLMAGQRDSVALKGFLDVVAGLMTSMHCNSYHPDEEAFKSHLTFTMTLTKFVVGGIKEFASFESLCENYGVAGDAFISALKNVPGNSKILDRLLVRITGEPSALPTLTFEVSQSRLSKRSESEYETNNQAATSCSQVEPVEQNTAEEKEVLEQADVNSLNRVQLALHSVPVETVVFPPPSSMTLPMTSSSTIGEGHVSGVSGGELDALLAQAHSSTKTTEEVVSVSMEREAVSTDKHESSGTVSGPTGASACGDNASIAVASAFNKATLDDDGWGSPVSKPVDRGVIGPSEENKLSSTSTFSGRSTAESASSGAPKKLASFDFENSIMTNFGFGQSTSASNESGGFARGDRNSFRGDRGGYRGGSRGGYNRDGGFNARDRDGGFGSGRGRGSFHSGPRGGAGNCGNRY